MGYNHLLLVFLLSMGVLAGDIAYTNCPSSFSMSTANTTSDANVLLSNRASSLFSAYISTASTTRVENIVVQGNNTDLLNYVTVLSIPYILFAVVFLVGLCTAIACCIFDKSCPPCDNWRRDYSKEPYKKSELRVVTGFAVVFSMSVAVVSVLAFTSLPEMKSSVDNTKCGMYLTLDAAMSGDATSGWTGIPAINNQLGNISSSLDSAVTAINTYFTNNDWLVNDMANQQMSNINLFKRYRNNTLASPDPNSTLDINSVFLSSGLGPNGTSGTMVNEIDTTLRTTKRLSDTAYAVDQSAKKLVDSKVLIQTNVVLSQNQMNMYYAGLKQFNTDLDAFSKAQIDSNFSVLLYIIEGVLGFTLVAALVGLMGVFATHLFDIYNCRLMVHLSWVIFGLSYLGVIALTFIFVPGGSIAYQVCNYFQKSLTNRTEFERLGGYYSENVLTRIEGCLFDDGNILRTFNAYSEMQTVQSLFTNIDSFTAMTTSSNSQYVDTSIAYNKITSWMASLVKYRDGVTVDSNAVETNDKNPQYSLKSLNDYTFRAVNGQNCSQDYWVFDNANCISAYNRYSPGTTTVNGITLTTTPLCISFNEAIAQGRDKWSQTDFGSRYVGIAQTCSASYPIIVNYGNALIRFRDSRIKLFQAILDDLTSLQTLNSNFNTNLQTFKGKVSSFTTSVTTLQNLVNSKLAGIQVSTNCTVLASELRFVYNSFCVNFMAQAVNMGTCLALLSVLIVGAIITEYVFALRYSKIEKEVLVAPELQMEEEIE